MRDGRTESRTSQKQYAPWEHNQDSIKSNSTSGKPRGQLFPSRCSPGFPEQNQQIVEVKQEADTQLQLE